MKNQYMTKKEKSFENTHKLHKNSKTYLDVQNEFAPKLKLSWVVSDPTQTWPAHCSGHAVTGETPFGPEGLRVLNFSRVGIGIFGVHGFWIMRPKKCLGSWKKTMLYYQNMNLFHVNVTKLVSVYRRTIFARDLAVIEKIIALFDIITWFMRPPFTQSALYPSSVDSEYNLLKKMQASSISKEFPLFLGKTNNGHVIANRIHTNLCGQENPSLSPEGKSLNCLFPHSLFSTVAMPVLSP